MEQEHKSKIKEDVGIFVKSFLHKASDLDNRITREYGADTTYSDSLHELTSDLNHSIIGLLVYKPNFEDLVFMIANLRHEGKLFIKRDKIRKYAKDNIPNRIDEIEQVLKETAKACEDYEDSLWSIKIHSKLKYDYDAEMLKEAKEKRKASFEILEKYGMIESFSNKFKWNQSFPLLETIIGGVVFLLVLAAIISGFFIILAIPIFLGLILKKK